MNSEKTITVWDRWSKDKNEWNFNHISDGWSEDEKPVPRGEAQQKSWPSGDWKKTKARLVDGVVKMEA